MKKVFIQAALNFAIRQTIKGIARGGQEDMKTNIVHLKYLADLKEVMIHITDAEIDKLLYQHNVCQDEMMRRLEDTFREIESGQ